MTGRLENVFIDYPLDKLGEIRMTDMASFCFGTKERKFFIGSNSGHILNMSMKNGDKIGLVSDEVTKDRLMESLIERGIYTPKNNHQI